MATTASSFPALGDPNANKKKDIMGASVVLIVLPTIFVFLRLLSRWMARANLWWDDYTVILALVLSWGPNIINLVGCQIGFGRHIYTLPVDTILSFFKYLCAFEFLYGLAMSSVKFSVITFQYRIFPVVQYRQIMIACGLFVVCTSIACVIVNIFQCIPISGFWETMAGTFPGANCINVMKFFLIISSINTATDFILLTMPIPLLWKLRTGVRQKLILTCTFTVGLTVCAVSIVRLKILGGFIETDISWDYVNPALWTAAEPSIGVMSACIPSLRPLFAKLVNGPPRTSGSTSSNNNLIYSGPTGGEPWRHNVAIKGGSEVSAGESEEFEIGLKDGAWEGKRTSLPPDMIRVHTTFTVTEKVEWLNYLY